MIEQSRDATVFDNAINLAAALNLTACIPVLLRTYLKGDGPTVVTLSRIERLAGDPAGLALIHMGNATLGPLQQSLQSASAGDRTKTIRVTIPVLALIHTPQANALLRRQYARDLDPTLRRRLQLAGADKAPAP
jgi:hypothetical protein